MGSQKKLYFTTIVDDNEYSLTVKLMNMDGKEVCIDKEDVLKTCFRYNYVLVRRQYAKDMGLK